MMVMHMRVVVRGVHLLPGVPACAGLCIAPSDVVFVLACGAPDCGRWQVSWGVLFRVRAAVLTVLGVAQKVRLFMFAFLLT